MNEDKTRQAIERGLEAKRILDSELFKSALKAMEADAIAAFKTAYVEDLVEAKADMLAVEKLERKLKAWLINGTIAERGLT